MSFLSPTNSLIMSYNHMHFPQHSPDRSTTSCVPLVCVGTDITSACAANLAPPLYRVHRVASVEFLHLPRTISPFNFMKEHMLADEEGNLNAWGTSNHNNKTLIEEVPPQLRFTTTTPTSIFVGDAFELRYTASSRELPLQGNQHFKIPSVTSNKIANSYPPRESSIARNQQLSKLHCLSATSMA